MQHATRYKVVLTITAITALGEINGSWFTNSTGLLSDALHLLGDGIPFLAGYFLLKGLLPAAEELEEIAESGIVLINAVFLAAVALYLGGRSIYLLYYPAHVEPWMVWFALFGLAGNAAQLYVAHGLKHAHHHASTHKSQMLHLWADLAASISVVLAGWVVSVSGYSSADSIASLVVAIITGYAAWQCAAALLSRSDAPHGHSHQGHHH